MKRRTRKRSPSPSPDDDEEAVLLSDDFVLHEITKQTLLDDPAGFVIVDHGWIVYMTSDSKVTVLDSDLKVVVCRTLDFLSKKKKV